MKAMWEELERVEELARAPGHTPRGVPNIDGATSGHRGSTWDMQDRGGDAQTMLQASAVVWQLLGGFPMQDHSPLGQGPVVMPSMLPGAKPTLALSEMNCQEPAPPGQQAREVQGESAGPLDATAVGGGRPGPDGAGGTVTRVAYAGVHLQRDGMWHAKLVNDPKNPSTIMLGLYADQLVAARAFAAAMYVVRRHIPIRGRVLTMQDADLEILRGCSTRHVEFLARRRAWGRWE
ncbi:unnamed protein product [Closterium sp. NIES-54]